MTGRRIRAKIFSLIPQNVQRRSEKSPLVMFLAPGFIGAVPWPLDLVSRDFDMQVIYEGYMHHLASYGITTIGLYEPRGSIFTKLNDVDHNKDAAEISSFLSDILEREFAIS